jgi:phenylalanyl-tRNA synthetase beta chain
VSIGTHDLDSIEGPFSYEALPPSAIQFVPLDKDVSVDGNGIMTMYEVWWIRVVHCTLHHLLALN